MALLFFTWCICDTKVVARVIFCANQLYWARGMMMVTFSPARTSMEQRSVIRLKNLPGAKSSSKTSKESVLMDNVAVREFWRSIMTIDRSGLEKPFVFTPVPPWRSWHHGRKSNQVLRGANTANAVVRRDTSFIDLQRSMVSYTHAFGAE